MASLRESNARHARHYLQLCAGDPAAYERERDNVEKAFRWVVREGDEDLQAAYRRAFPDLAREAGLHPLEVEGD